MMIGARVSYGGMVRLIVAVAVGIGGFTAAMAWGEDTVGVVSNIKVVSQHVPDVSSLEAWKKAFIKEGMSDKEKALAIFNTEVAFQVADAPPPCEYIQREDVVLDPVKIWNVYGYTFCSVSAANVSAMARYAGLKGRVWTVQNHTIPEIYYDGAWHMLDSDLIEYFPKADGSIASVQELVDGIQAWLKEHPEFSVDPAKKNDRYKFMAGGAWKAKGPEILSRSPFYDDNGWLPCIDFAWGDTMQQFSKVANNWQSGFSQGYQVNIQLRPGEVLTRNFSNKKLHANMDSGRTPSSLSAKMGAGSFRNTPKWGDLAPGRIGNGRLEYTVPLASGQFRTGALMADNLAAKSEEAGPAVHVKDAAKPGVLEIRMPCSYLYLGGELTLTAAIGEGGEIKALISDNNGLDWKDLATVTASGEQKIDLKSFILRRYVYQVRLVMKGKGTGLEALKFSNDIQHSQRVLPALKQGENKIAFSAGAAEGTISIEGAMDPMKDEAKRQKINQLSYYDFHPKMDGFAEKVFPRSEGTGSVTFSVKTPGDMVRVRASDFFTTQGKSGNFTMDVSFDDGKTWKMMDKPALDDREDGRNFVSRYATFAEVPAGTRAALVRYSASGNGTVALCQARIDADYKEPAGGFRPVKVTYVWEEGGLEKTDIHVARQPNERYTVKCEGTPLMKSVVLELADEQAAAKAEAKAAAK